MPYTDEQLSAFIDGELAPDEMAAIETALGATPGLRGRIDALRMADEALRGAYDPIAAAPVPAALKDAVARRLAETAPPSLRPRRSPMRFAPAAVAAGLALAVGVGPFLTNPRGSDSRALLAAGVDLDADLARFLNETPSGRSTIVGARTLRAVLTYRNAEGALCREFAVIDPAAAARGIACAPAGGEWRLAFFAAEEAPAAGGEFSTASGGASEIDRYIERTIDGAALGADEERIALGARG